MTCIIQGVSQLLSQSDLLAQWNGNINSLIMGAVWGAADLISDVCVSVCVTYKLPGWWRAGQGSAETEGGWASLPVCSWPSWCWLWRTPAVKSGESPGRNELPLKMAKGENLWHTHYYTTRDTAHASFIIRSPSRLGNYVIYIQGVWKSLGNIPSKYINLNTKSVKTWYSNWKKEL